MASAPLRLFPTVMSTPPTRSPPKNPRSKSPMTTGDKTRGGLDDDRNRKPASDTIPHSLLCDPSEEILASISNRPDAPDDLKTVDRANDLTLAMPISPKNGQSPRSLSTVHAAQEKQIIVHTPQSNISPNTRSSPKSLGNAETKTFLPAKTAQTTPVHPFTTPSSNAGRFTSSSPSLSAPSSSKSSPRSQDYTDSPPMRSMFPQYDHSRSLSQQQYYSRVPSRTFLHVPTDPVSKIDRPSDKRPLKHFDSAVGLVDGYEHVPAARAEDLRDIWRASCEEFPITGRKVQLSLHQFSAQGTALAIGQGADQMVYSMDRIDTQSTQQNPSRGKEMAVKKHHPTEKSNLPVAHLSLPDRSTVHASGTPLTSIFPQAAAVDAIEYLLTTPDIDDTKHLDEKVRSPTETSCPPMGARFAHDAIAASQRRYNCDLVRKDRRRDSLGSVTAAYELRHPTLGTFVINVTKSYSTAAPTIPRAKISLHHPSATPTAVAAETLNLAFLDFARDACVLDVPGLLALDAHYLVDTVVAALLAVAVIENDALLAEALVFDAPPKIALSDGSKKQSKATAGSKSTKRGSSRSKTRRDKKREKAGKRSEEDELPMLTQGALALLGLSFKAAVLVLHAGVKVTAGVVVGVSNVAKKL